MDRAKYIQFDKIGSSSLGFITVAENFKNIPFEVKRVYWTYYTPQDVIRGGHAHKNLEQVIIAVSGVIEFNTEDKQGNKQTFILDNPSTGLYLPKLVWRDIKFSHSSVLLCLASEFYIEDDYIRNYDDFLNLNNLQLVNYTKDILEKSWHWLNDPEIKHLTSTPDFSKEDQQNWFSGLENNDTYWVQGIQYENKIIGVAGLKKIDSSKKTAEYFGYIGEKEFWGKGLSKDLFRLIFKIAKDQFGLESLYLNVVPDNIRAVKSYEKAGFSITDRTDSNIKMSLNL